MKIRSGFISNSSSSSFMLGLKGSPAKVKLCIEVDVQEYGSLISTEEELEDYYLDEYGSYGSTVDQLLANDEYLSKTYNAAKEHIKGGNSVLIGTVSNDDSPIENLLYCNGFPESDYYDIMEQAVS